MRRINKENLIKILILTCFALFYLKLIRSKEILNYIHPRMIPFIKVSIVIMILICIFSLTSLTDSVYKRFNYKKYRIFLIPLLLLLLVNPKADISGLQKQNSSLSQINDTSNENLQNKSKEADFDKNINSDDKKAEVIDDKGTIKVSDDNYMKISNEIFSNVDKYDGRKIEVTGFVYKDDTIGDKDFVIARYLMVCCAADMQVVGFLCKDSSSVYNADTWVKVNGTIRKNEGSDIDILYIETEKIEKIDAPKEQYVYPRY